MAGTVQIHWYATAWRGDQFAEALSELAPIAARYNGERYELLRARDDRYRFLHLIDFNDKLDFERFWQGPELVEFRAEYSGWYQVPLQYDWYDRLREGALNSR